MKKDLIIGIGVGIPVLIVMVIIGGSGHESADLESIVEVESAVSEPTLSQCSGTASCITGIVTRIIDGDTIKVDNQSIRFALVDAPEMKYDGGQARDFVEELCPVGSTVIVDQDDNQLVDKYGRILGVIYCNDLNLNKEVLDSGLGDLYSAFCDQSEFADDPWAVKHGCVENWKELD